MIAPAPRVAALRRLLVLYVPAIAVGLVLVLANIGVVNGGLVAGLFITSLAVTVASRDLEANL